MVSMCKALTSEDVDDRLDKIIDLFLRTDSRDNFIAK